MPWGHWPQGICTCMVDPNQTHLIKPQHGSILSCRCNKLNFDVAYILCFALVLVVLPKVILSSRSGQVLQNFHLMSYSRNIILKHKTQALLEISFGYQICMIVCYSSLNYPKCSSVNCKSKKAERLSYVFHDTFRVNKWKYNRKQWKNKWKWMKIKMNIIYICFSCFDKVMVP